MHEQGWYRTQDVQLRTGVTVTGIDRDTHQLQLAGRERLGYDKLALATGSSPRSLPIPGPDLARVQCLRTVGDSDRLRAAIAAGGPVVVVGAGWIGLEAAARLAGVQVTVCAGGRVATAAAGAGSEMGAVFTALHRDHGVDLRLETGIAKITGDGRGFTVRHG